MRGAAWRLAELGERSVLVLERNPHPGGLAASFRDEAGFTWDIGGHVVFSHYSYFDNLVESLLDGDSDTRYELMHEPERPIKTTIKENEGGIVL